ncbi:MAG: TIM barrel protein [Anaerolineae bacterium]|nr:TIM barrel protein [Anaerolineae bacterium]
MTIRMGNAPVSWGIYEFKDIEPKYPYERVLDEIVETGYTGIELGPWGYLPTNPAVLKPILDKKGLQLLSSYVPVKLVDASAHAAGEEHALSVGRLLAACGAKVIVLADDNGTVPELIAQAGRRKGSALSPAQWDVFAAGVNRIAKKVFDELGLKIMFHHHCAGYVETPEETRIFLDRTDSELVGLCLDTGHYQYAGGDALEAVKTYGERVRYLHLKDCDPNIRELCIKEKLNYFQAVQAGVFCELGKGSVDFPAILTHMDSLGYDGWAIVEQDILTDDLDAPRRSARRNRDYLKKLGY